MDAAIYPGSFDPVTNGHVDLFERGARLFDELIVAIAQNPAKAPLFTVDERVQMVGGLVAHLPNVRVESFDGLAVEHARARGMRTILRGIRTLSDFEFEFQMALTNRTLAPEIETVFVMTSESYAYVSSRLIKEVAHFGGDLSAFIPSQVWDRLRAKLHANGSGGA